MTGSRARLLAVARVVAIAGAIVAGLSLAVLRAYVEPIFGPSDENDHFDYAISLARAGHLLSARNDLRNPADLETSFLETYSGFSRIYLNTGDRVPPTYGSHQYYRRIDDRSARELPDPHAALDARDHPNPVLISMYPFAYYGLVAAWIDVTTHAGSLSSAFFSARLFSVVLLASTLVFAYGVARELRLSRVTAVAFTAVLGMFALTTFVASYVQPDNLAAAATSGLFYVTLRLRRPGTPVDWIATSTLFAILTVTKYQIALCVALAAVPMLATALHARRPGAVVRTMVVGALPSLAALAVQTFVVGKNASFAASVATHFAAFTSAGRFPLEFGAFLGRCFEALYYYFIGNVTEPLTHDYRFAAAISYWNMFGNLDTPVTLVNPFVDRVARLLIPAGTVVVAAAAIARVTQTSQRLWRIAGRRRATAVRLALSDTPFNAYVAFIAFMVLFYALTNNNWRQSGRNWYPFIVPALLLGIAYAPRAFASRRARVGFGTTVLALLALYATIGSYSAAAAVHERYYGAPYLPRLATLARGPQTDLLIDRVGDVMVAKAPGPSAQLVRGATLEITGLAPDDERRERARGVVALIDGRDEFAASFGYAHQDLAEFFGDGPLFWSGFHFFIDTGALSLGPHHITFFVVSGSREARPTPVSATVILLEPGSARPLEIGDHRTIVGSLDQVTTIENASVFGPEPLPPVLDRADALFVRGWAVDLGTKRPLRALELAIDGTRRSDGHLGDLRPELRDTFRDVPPLVAAYGGYSAILPMTTIPLGTHRLSMTAVDANGRRLDMFHDVPFVVVAPRDRSALWPEPPAFPHRIDAPDVLGSIDRMAPLRGLNDAPQSYPIWIPHDDALALRGWAIDELHSRALGAIDVAVDHGAPIAARLGDVRPDVRLALPSAPVAATETSGWNVVIPVTALARGRHTLDLTIVDPRTNRPVRILRDAPFSVY